MLPELLALPPTVSDCESWSFLLEGFPPTMCMSRVNGWINTDLALNEKDRCDRRSEANERQTRPDCRRASPSSTRGQAREGPRHQHPKQNASKTVLRCVPDYTYTL